MNVTLYNITKRALDVAGAAAFLTVTAPITLVVAAGVRMRMGSPVLFRHSRPGLNEQIFPCLKFRTMTDARDRSGRLLEDAERLTAFGQFLRRYSLDEFPQFWNVLRGEMSLVGPRPLEVRYLPRYNSDQRGRHSVKPGITGWAQINGRNSIDWETKFALDLWYVEHRSLWLDLKILAITFWKVLTGHGISSSGHATMPDFWGTDAHPANVADPRHDRTQQEEFAKHA